MSFSIIPTERDARIADRLVAILEEEKCTVLEAESILDKIRVGIRYSSTVQKINYQELLKDALKR